MTYPSARVQAALARYVRVVLDLKEHSTTAELLVPEAIPVSIVLDARGAELGRHVGFADAQAHAQWLSGFAR